jgi:hypothetical protein
MFKIFSILKGFFFRPIDGQGFGELSTDREGFCFEIENTESSLDCCQNLNLEDGDGNGNSYWCGIGNGDGTGCGVMYDYGYSLSGDGNSNRIEVFLFEE